MSRSRQELAPARRSSVGRFEVSSVWFVAHGVETCETAVRMDKGAWMVVRTGPTGYDAHDHFVAMASDGGRPWRLEAWIDEG